MYTIYRISDFSLMDSMQYMYVIFKVHLCHLFAVNGDPEIYFK